MFITCTTTDSLRKTVNAFKNEDGNLVVERSLPFRKVIDITYPKDLAGSWVFSDPEEFYISISYGVQGLIYKPIP
ncbi:hypothetical protein ACS91J_13465 [Pectobacterium carotovorum]|uniref:Uncharacterized protein n=1 Tax=Pectobacterium parvum TaxID=2778550 RepID=A0AAP9IIU1_9GAMM|nr:MULTISPECIES: hypothetical protein [Pectobacterium]MBK4825918.1 hypothetical protein [Pectobacterium carotovorum subsp. carotovorum]QHQ25892.1 hypothetical protein GMX10_19035 [Pectobacterium parvum]UNE77903.1 hypothetical protein IMY97_23040 [Pectobacterium versatile]